MPDTVGMHVLVQRPDGSGVYCPDCEAGQQELARARRRIEFYSTGSPVDVTAYGDSNQIREAEERRSQNRAEAEARAMMLLREVLADDQIESLGRNGWFEVRVDRRVFRIAWGGVQNITEIENGVPVRNYCIVPQAPVPIADILVSQKMLMESDIELFERTAVVSGLRARQPEQMPTANGGQFEITFTTAGWITSVTAALIGAAIGLLLGLPFIVLSR